MWKLSRRGERVVSEVSSERYGRFVISRTSSLGVAAALIQVPSVTISHNQSLPDSRNNDPIKVPPRSCCGPLIRKLHFCDPASHCFVKSRTLRLAPIAINDDLYYGCELLKDPGPLITTPPLLSTVSHL